MDKKILIIIIALILICCGIFFATNSNITINNDEINIDETQLEKTVNNSITEDIEVENKLYTTDKSDTNALLVENNSSVSVTNSLINKTGDTSSNGDDVDFYGTNSAILVKSGSQLDISNSKIITNSTGSNAIFVTNAEGYSQDENTQSMGNPSNAGTQPQGDISQPPDINASQPQGGISQPPEGDGGNAPEDKSNQENVAIEQSQQDSYVSYYEGGGANATIKNVEISTFKDKSRGLDATFGGKIDAENVIINTRGSSCAALATDRGEGILNVKNSQLNTGVDNSKSRGSPCIYSTGNISVENTKGTAYNSQIACIEGKNSITMNDCTFNCYATGNREDNGKYVDLGGIFIYQSMSGDADVGTSSFNVTNSHLSIDESSQYYSLAPMIHTTNTKSNINIKDTTFEFGSNIFLEASGQTQWGNTGSNGADVNLTITDEEITGDIIVDSISTLNYTLISSKYVGTINSNDSFGQTNIIIESDSTWTLTGDSHITSLENNGTIEYGNYTLYIDGHEYNRDNPYK